MDEQYEPKTIDVAKDRGVTITFFDGHIASIDLMTLRLACPCAACRALRDRGEAAWPRPGSPMPLRIESANVHGAWGLVVAWNDGHATGIFPFESLRRWDGWRCVRAGLRSGWGGPVISDRVGRGHQARRPWSGERCGRRRRPLHRHHQPAR